jgi:hypothetical protein
MSWNYRVIHRKTKDPDEPDVFSIHEVYYNKGGTPEMVTVSEIAPISNTYNGLVKNLKHYMKALQKPILEFDDFTHDGYNGGQDDKGKEDPDDM